MLKFNTSGFKKRAISGISEPKNACYRAYRNKTPSTLHIPNKSANMDVFNTLSKHFLTKPTGSLTSPVGFSSQLLKNKRSERAKEPTSFPLNNQLNTETQDHE